MQKISFEVTPSFLCSLIRKSGSLKNNFDVITAFEKLSLLEDAVLDKEHASIIDDEEMERKLLFDNIEPKLIPLAEDLYGLIKVREPESKDEES